MLQSCGTSRDRHPLSSNDGASAPVASPRKNRQSRSKDRSHPVSTWPPKLRRLGSDCNSESLGNCFSWAGVVASGCCASARDVTAKKRPPNSTGLRENNLNVSIIEWGVISGDGLAKQNNLGRKLKVAKSNCFLLYFLYTSNIDFQYVGMTVALTLINFFWMP